MTQADAHGHPLTAAARKPSDFRFGKEIGQGSFSSVFLARELATNAEFAIKVVDKQHVRKNRAVESVLMEKEVLRRTCHPFIVRLHYTFQDASSLYYVLDYLPHKELLTHLNRFTCLDVKCVRFYTAELLYALNYLHEQSIVHRDVKPENILLTDHMHIKLVDFGSAIILNDPQVKPPLFTGTPEYMSPEMLSSHAQSIGAVNDDPSHKSFSFEQIAYLIDYWALGCVLYVLISGKSPFRPTRNQHVYEIFGKIANLDYSFMDGFDPEAKNLIQKLLLIDPLQRLGSPPTGGPTALRAHPFFNLIEWDTLPQQTPPVLEPNLNPIAPVECVGQNPDDDLVQTSNDFDLNNVHITDPDRKALLTQQERLNPYHRFVRCRLILKQGVLFKRRGLFARKRVFLLTEGPHLFYVDPDSMTLKGEVPWTSFLKVELKSEKIFFIHDPNRTYYLEDACGQASLWVDRITAVKNMYYSTEHT